ncbi:hypothetical protein NPIL_53411 [Nephila pilipes]|uniref:Uncharacterized protein n=1 Tax=Nephila pilipes TaxID=299642 RepID=A0A8X6TTV9_NEPPI|nr:hypothetical protein NPIL_53411 [Nephila pilipes]
MNIVNLCRSHDVILPLSSYTTVRSPPLSHSQKQEETYIPIDSSLSSLDSSPTLKKYNELLILPSNLQADIEGFHHLEGGYVDCSNVPRSFPPPFTFALLQSPLLYALMRCLLSMFPSVKCQPQK